MRRPYKLLTLGDPFKVATRPIEGWELHTIPPQIGPPNLCHLPPHRDATDNHISRFIRALKPDFVVIICEGCTERRLNRMQLPKGPKYVTWSTDSYRHAVRVTTSDLHLSAIPDEAIRGDDHFVPLFAGDHGIAPLSGRSIRCGIICRTYRRHGSHRERELERLRRVMPDLYRAEDVGEDEYNSGIREFVFGLNIAVYPDALPNFRSFQLGRAGVMPVSSTANEQPLRQLFGEHIVFYGEVEDVPVLLRDRTYDERRLKAYYDAEHSYEARLREIFARFFDMRM